MAASQKICEYCGKKYRAYRSDSKYCLPKCRDRNRAEDRKFAREELKRKYVRGVTYHCILKKWVVHWPDIYLGSFESFESAVSFLDSAKNKEKSDAGSVR